MNEVFMVTNKDIDRSQVMEQLEAKVIRQKKAAEILGISVRHIQRLLALYRKEGIQGLVSKKFGRPSPNRIPDSLRHEVKEIIATSEYYDFGPTMMCEILQERHQIEISIETTRALMIDQEIWTTKKVRRPRIHQPRTRMERFGELVQIDGSPHAWFEDGDQNVR